MLSQRIVAQPFAMVVVMFLSFECQVAEAAGQYRFENTQYQSSPDFDFKLEYYRWDDDLETYVHLGTKNYTYQGGDPQWMIYSWKVVHTIVIGNNEPNHIILGEVYRKNSYDPDAPGNWNWVESFSADEQ